MKQVRTRYSLRKALDKTTSKLRKLFPAAKDCHITVTQNETGDYLSKIEMKLHHKKFVAKKTGPTIQTVLNHTLRAISKQTRKFKHHHFKVNHYLQLQHE